MPLPYAPLFFAVKVTTLLEAEAVTGKLTLAVMAATTFVATFAAVSPAETFTGQDWPEIIRRIVPPTGITSLVPVTVNVSVPVAASAVGSSAIGNAQSSLVFVFLRNARIINASWEPAPNAASACSSLVIKVNAPFVLILELSGWPIIKFFHGIAPDFAAIEPPISTAKIGTRLSAGICSKDMLI